MVTVPSRWLRFWFALVVAVAVSLVPPSALAQRVQIIRDTEIERTVLDYSVPVFRAAGLDPASVEIYLVRDNTINAFVAGGQRMFLNTGLLMQSQSPNQLIGVIAHEVGHIEGGHLSRVHDAMRNASVEAIIGLVAGIAAGIATGRADVGSAIARAGEETALRSFLRYSRTQEGAADSAAMRLLDATGQSSRGLLEFLEMLEDQELLMVGRQDPYLRTHPVTRERIDALRAHLSRSRHADAPSPPGFEAKHARMVAKLTGFLQAPDLVLRRYPESDTSIEARYARAVAWYRRPDLDRALSEIETLLRLEPQNAYFHELKGQMLFEHGRPGEALAPYETAASLMPDAPLLRFALAQVQIAMDRPDLLDDAVRNLEAGLLRDRRNSAAWRQLAIAHGRQGNMGESALAQAEEALLTGRADAAVFHAGKAQQLLPQGSRGWLQAQDVERAAEQQQRRRN
ncbi:MAG: M48 family peptidase [Rhodospirillales bacterium]|nr:MAG: M48 family peptidase [Rhodospirillales bacterium]